MQTLLLGSLQLGFLYGIMALGIYVSFRILNVPDLTVDGSFALGMAVAVMVCINGHPILSLVSAAIAGAAAGYITGLLQTKVGIHPILSGILTMTGLYSVNLFIMQGKSNVAIVSTDPSKPANTIFSLLEQQFHLTPDAAKTVGAVTVCLLVVVILALTFMTKAGITIRATGDNEEMVRSSSINAGRAKCIGLALANGCVGLAGGMLCQYLSFSDVNYGSGMVVIGLASVIIGETIFGKRHVTAALILAVAGSIIYRFIIAGALKVELFPAYGLKLVSAVIVAAALAMPSLKEWIRLKYMRKKEQNAIDGK